MRTISKLLKLGSSFDMTTEERVKFSDWLNFEARYNYDAYDYCILLGWYVLDDYIPLSPKEAGFD